MGKMISTIAKDSQPQMMVCNYYCDIALGLDERGNNRSGCLCMIRGCVWKQLRLWVKVLTALWLLMVVKSLVFRDYDSGVQDDKTDVLTYHKKLLAEAVKEKDELKTKLENFQSSSKGLRSSDVEDSPVYDRFAKVEGMHAVPPPMTRNYMPPKSDFGIDESQFSYGPKQSKLLNLMLWTNSDDEYVIKTSKEQEKPNFAFVNFKHVKTPRETIKEQNTCSQSPQVDKRDWNGLMSKRLGLGYGFTKKACFVCGSFSHLIRDCDFHEKRMAKQVIERVGEVAYKLELPEELSRVHNTVHVSNLKKCHADEPLAIPLDGLHLDDKLHFVEEPLEIVGREVKRLKRSRIPLVKV
ncbi:hypothetical protein Tco_0400313 [Tanacetum coccineum]